MYAGRAPLTPRLRMPAPTEEEKQKLLRSSCRKTVKRIFVFTNPDTGTRYTDVKSLSLQRVGKLALPNFTFHDLRHTFGTRLADAGVDVVKIKELMGHASIVTTMRYIHATDQGKRGAIVVLSEYRQKRRHKFVTDDKRQTLQPAVSHC
jgi:integrase